VALLGNLTGSSQFFNNTEFYNGVIGQSLRLSVGSDYKLDRQMVTPTSVTGTICTASWWMKKSAHGTVQSFIQCRDNQASGNYSAYWTYDGGFSGSDHHSFRNETDSLHVGTNTSVVPYRDPSGWYHVVIRYDSTQGTAADRIRIYKNGTLQNSTFTTTTYPSQNHVDTFWNNAGEHLILFGNGEDSGDSFDGYIAEFNWVDGQSLAPETFGELKNGVWIPKKITLSTSDYGLNGSRYTFADSSDIGKDTSGVGNDLDRVSNLAASDVVLDSPENNFATINSLTKVYRNSGSITISEGNLQTASTNSGSGVYGHSTFGMATGKWYWEVLAKTMGGSYGSIGIGNQNSRNNIATDASPNPSIGIFYDMGGTRSPRAVNSGFTSYGASWAEDDIIGIAFDADNESVNFYKNNSAQGAVGSILTQANGPYFAINGDAQNNTNYTFVNNFGQDSSFAGNKTAQGNTDGNGIGDFYYAPPSGYLALCTANLPEPTIGSNSATQADDHFNTVLYTGNGSSSSATQDISGVGFKPDWLWIKRRNSSASHNLRDSSRGVLKHLQSDGSGSEDTESDAGVTAFLDDGFRLKGTNAGSGQVNANGGTFVAWNWKANGGTTSTNDDGAGTSTVQANTTAGFSIVTYTGSSNETYGHGLDSAPEMILVKGRNIAHNWAVYHQGVQDGTANGFLELNTTSAIQTGSNPRFLNGTTSTSQPTSTVFNVNHYSGSSTNASNQSDTYVAYCFHSIEGYSKFGSYTGNSSSDGVFIYTGFRPAWFMVKVASGFTNNWTIYDNKTTTHNPDDTYLLANGNGAEVTANAIDFLSNGIKLRNSSQAENNSSGTYIYMAFAEAPFKYANAR